MPTTVDSLAGYLVQDVFSLDGVDGILADDGYLFSRSAMIYLSQKILV